MSKIATSLSNVFTALDRSSATALHRQLYNQLREAILSGRLSAGTRLPSTRELAYELGLARNTVLNAFDQLHAEGYLTRRVGDGTYVSKELPDDLLRVQGVKNVRRESQRNGRHLSKWGKAVSSISVSPGNYLGPPRPFRTGTPALDAFPYKLWGRLLTQRWKESARAIVPYGDSAGYLPLRKAIASYLSTTRGVRCIAEHVIVTSGSLHALEIIARVILEAGDSAWIEDPGFLGARAALNAAGAHLIPVPVDADGLNVVSGIK